MALILTAGSVSTGCDARALVDAWGARTPVETPVRVVTFSVEVEAATGLDVDEVGTEVAAILNAPRGWSALMSIRFEPWPSGRADVRIVVATPDTVDAGCAPLGTGGYLSCRNGGRVWLNVDRWTGAVPHWTAPLAEYRAYLVNHEVGHFLGHGHENCPGEGRPAPVMQQQTKSLGGCRPNGWLIPTFRPAGVI